MELKYKLKRDDGRVVEISAVNEAIYEVVRNLAIAVGVVRERKAGEQRTSTLAIESMLKTYKSEHGVSGLTEAVEAELRILHELHPDRVRVCRVCFAHEGISCDYAVARGDGKRGLKDLCTYQGDCELSREEAV